MPVIGLHISGSYEDVKVTALQAGLTRTPVRVGVTDPGAHMPVIS